LLTSKKMGNEPGKGQAVQQPRKWETPPTRFVFADLPDELWIRILRHLNMKELLHIQFCCKRFAELARDNSLWSPFCKKWIIDRQHAIRLARRRRVARFEAEIAGVNEKPWKEEDVEDGDWLVVGREIPNPAADKEKEKERKNRKLTPPNNNRDRASRRLRRRVSGGKSLLLWRKPRKPDKTPERNPHGRRYSLLGRSRGIIAC